MERLQLDTFRRLSKAIALLSVVAWQLLWLKQLAKQAPELEAAHVFEPLQLQVLGQQTGQKVLTVKPALVAIAALAGFTPSKKQPLPGEKAIWRGWNSFSSMCRGYKLALQESYGTGQGERLYLYKPLLLLSLARVCSSCLLMMLDL